MTKKLTDPQHYEDIADAIRLKNGSSDTYTPSQMAGAISVLPTGDNLGDSIDETLDKYIYNGDKTSFARQYQGSSIYAKDLTLVPITQYTTYAFAYNQSEKISLPNATTGGRYSFYYCTKMKEINLPLTTKLYQNQFRNCTLLETVNIPAVVDMETNVFLDTPALKALYIPNCTNSCFSLNGAAIGATNLEILDLAKNDNGFSAISRYIVGNNSKLTHLAIRSTTMVTLGNPVATAMATCPITQGNGWVYVPRNLISSYQAATNWSTLGTSQWRALEDYTVDGTITGDLDPSKI